MFKKMGFAKRLSLFSLSLILCLCLAGVPCTRVKASMAVPMPILPYVPPETTSIIDYIFNAFGATAPDIPATVERHAAYVRLWNDMFGEAAEGLWNDLMSAIGKGKTSGKLTIATDLIPKISRFVGEAVENGLQYGESYPVSLTAAQWQQRLASQYGITISTDKVNEIYSARGTGYVSNRESFLLYAVGSKTGYLPNEQTITFMTMATLYGNSASIKQYSNGFFYPWYTGASEPVSCSFFVYRWNSQTRVVGEYLGSAAGGCAFNSVSEQGTTAAYNGSVATVSAQSAEIEQALTDGDVIPVSAYTALNVDGTVDDTKPAVIPMPLVDTVPATSLSDLTSAQADNGVASTISDTDVSSIVQALQQSQTATYGPVSDYSLDLTGYFPFCIPIDIGNILTAFVADPEAPHVQFSLPIGYDKEEGILFHEFEMDLSQFDEVALWVRRGMLIVFIVGLGMVTRQVFTRG